MNLRPLILVLFAGVATTPAVAHEDGVYESLGHIPIGRIFLTAEERARLDRMRGKEPAQPTSAKSPGDGRLRVSNDDGAGFIVSDSGRTRVWRGGDFVATASADDVRFPGEVRIASHPAPQGSDDAGESDENLESPVGAGDEQE